MNWGFVRSEPGEDPIIVEGYFKATPARVFQAWTVPHQVEQWFGPAPNSLHSAVIDLRPGGSWRFLKSSDAVKSVGFEGKYLIIVPDQHLVFTWSQVVARADGERTATTPSRVEIRFTPHGGGTNLTVIHSAISDEATRRGFGGGWERGFTNLSALFTSR
jgi:uncharacterized protein YndB with AHSA1/START domain